MDEMKDFQPLNRSVSSKVVGSKPRSVPSSSLSFVVEGLNGLSVVASVRADGGIGESLRSSTA